ncbi:hypothetical protein GIB67_038131 [Kingdonia uniflora]|uniref:Glycosyl hydrolase family 32 C-terminal domain-containing protein n=1 Tax=Kingdonia uniflora TaxID=39325 RepID=A0A7J7M1Y2_9MAGN|nr:hypothetical protein GIB67_038131 [Kingdonia uniflora]
MVSLDDTKHDVYTVGQYYQEKDKYVPNTVRRRRFRLEADVEVSFELSTLEKAEVMAPSWVNPQLLCSQKGATVKGGVGPFGLLVLASKDLEDCCIFTVFRGNNRYVVLMGSDQADKTTHGAFLDVDPLQEKLSLRSLIDNSIVESFGVGGKACMTARVYPNLAIDGAHLYVLTMDLKM